MIGAGKVDLGWVGTRVFDTLGVASFQAVTAPMLIDNLSVGMDLGRLRVIARIAVTNGPTLEHHLPFAEGHM
jgi:hypothetical protein